jgi:hypothetical protein
MPLSCLPYRSALFVPVNTLCPLEQLGCGTAKHGAETESENESLLYVSAASHNCQQLHCHLVTWVGTGIQLQRKLLSVYSHSNQSPSTARCRLISALVVGYVKSLPLITFADGNSWTCLRFFYLFTRTQTCSYRLLMSPVRTPLLHSQLHSM